MVRRDQLAPKIIIATTGHRADKRNNDKIAIFATNKNKSKSRYFFAQRVKINLQIKNK